MWAIPTGASWLLKKKKNQVKSPSPESRVPETGSDPPIESDRDSGRDIACTSYLSSTIWRGLVATEIKRAYNKMKHQFSKKMLFQQINSISQKGVCKK